MLKKIALILMTATLLLCGLLTAQAGSLSQADIYAELQAELHRCLDNDENAKPLDNLTKRFESLNGYMKSAQFGYYAAILRDAEAGEDSRLALYTRLLRMDADFCAMLPEQGFPTVDEVEAYALGRQAQEKGDWNAAIGYYEQSIAVMDSMARVMELLTAEPTATPTPVPYIVAEDESHGDYTIDVYSDGTCAISSYSGSASTLHIPETIGWYRVKEIGAGAFYYCQSLINISIPDSVVSIKNLAFLNCYSLTNVTIPSSTTSIEGNPFTTCPNLTTITISPSNTFFSNIDGALFDNPSKLLIYYPCSSSLESYAIPYGTTAIGEYAFYACSTKYVSIPDSVTSIGECAFSHCRSLTSVSIPDSVTSIGYAAFAYCPNLTLHVPANSYAEQYAIDNGIPYTTY